ncbi:MAG: hypothetical protein QXD48_00790 [Candidatus Aenigmatarchaeota archaeon]
MENFEKYVEEAMNKIVKTYQHDHPLYQETHIVKSIINKDKQIAAFVLFEQIDTDRYTPNGDGWRGDQYRYSVWYIRGFEEPKQIYEDHAWKRRSISGLTGTKGRDPYIGLEELLEDGVIVTITPEGTQDAYGDLSQVKVKITFDGKIEEPEDFIERAKNLVKRIGPKLGYDYLSGEKQLEGKNVAAFVWAAENGSTYGYDTVYLVWKDKKGKINYEELTNSRYDKAYLSIDELREEGDKIIIKVKGRKYERSKKELGLK